MALKKEVVAAIVFGFAIGISGVLAYYALAHQGDLKVDIDSVQGVIRISAKGSNAKALTEVLEDAWKKDETTSKGLLSTWGLPHSFINVSDENGLRKFDLIRANDFGQIASAISNKHIEKWADLLQLSTILKSRVAPKVVPVLITYGNSNAISNGRLRFRRGDKNLSGLLNRACTLKPLNSETKLDLLIDMGIDLPVGFVQIQDADFVDLIAQLNQFEAPERNTEAWKRILRIGKVRGEIWI